MAGIRVGTCGYQYYDPGPDWQSEYPSKLAAYSNVFPVGELNRTFYRLPQTTTARRWRREASDDFEFTLKAWQAITHPWDSPTWNKYRDTVPDADTDEVGYFKPTDTVRDAFKETIDRANALEAEILVLQSPPSFSCTEDNIENFRSLLDTVDTQGVTLAWEPRGDWLNDRAEVQSICEAFDLIHVVDIIRDEPAADNAYLYTRLHGMNDDRYDYDYEYSPTELDALASTLEEYAQSHQRVYCLFNNYEMYTDALALIDRLGPAVGF